MMTIDEARAALWYAARTRWTADPLSLTLPDPGESDRHAAPESPPHAAPDAAPVAAPHVASHVASHTSQRIAEQHRRGGQSSSNLTPPRVPPYAGSRIPVGPGSRPPRFSDRSYAASALGISLLMTLPVLPSVHALLSPILPSVRSANWIARHLLYPLTGSPVRLTGTEVRVKSPVGECVVKYPVTEVRVNSEHPASYLSPFHDRRSCACPRLSGLPSRHVAGPYQLRVAQWVLGGAQKQPDTANLFVS